MLDLDKYINNSIKIKIFGGEYDIPEPTIGMNMEVNRIEDDITTENMHQKRVEVAKLFLNANAQGHIFTEEELMNVPFEGISQFLAEIALLKVNADLDPNLESQSQPEK